MTSLRHRFTSARLRSGLFSLVFSPLALIFLGSSMVDVQSTTAVGQPLASVEGLIGMALAAIMLALIAMNCDESSTGMYVTFTWSVLIGVGQFVGFLRVPLLMKSSLTPADVSAGVSWGLYPVAVSAILLACALTIQSVRRRIGMRTRMPLARVHRHAFGASVATPAALAAGVCMVGAAPADSTHVAVRGLAGILVDYTPQPFLVGGAVLALAIMTVSARWSITGTLIAAWGLLVVPAYLVLPVWASLTGRVVVPGASVVTQVSLACPVIAAVGMVVGSVSLGVLWARQRAMREHMHSSDSHDDASNEGPAES